MPQGYRVRIRYKQDNKSFGKLMMSKQTQDLADEAAKRGVIEAKAMAGRLGLPAAYVESIKAVKGPPVTMAGNPRRTARVNTGFPFIEFGSGQKRPRPQGGNSPAYRVLGSILSLIGNPPDRR